MNDFCTPDDNDVKREVKQIIVIRRDLKMRRGKEIAQGGHAAMRFLTMRIRQCKPMSLWDKFQMMCVAAFFFIGFGACHSMLTDVLAFAIPLLIVIALACEHVSACKVKFSEAEKIWINGTFSKITLQVDTEAQLLELAKKAKDAGLETHLVCDTGKTEFGGVPTNTCLGIGPDYADKIDPITGHLKIY